MRLKKNSKKTRKNKPLDAYSESNQEIFLIYDGKCPLCSASARAVKIRKAVGHLQLINAREAHPILQEINKAELNLDKGMVVKFNNKLYHGADAQNLLAMIGSDSDWFNRFNVFLFRSQVLSKLMYPIFKTVRSILLKLRGISNIDNLHSAADNQPILKSVFGNDWKKIPEVMQKHYSIQPFSTNKIMIKGKLDINQSGIFSFFSPLFQLLGILAPSGKNIPIHVILHGDPNTSYFYFDRTFYFPRKKIYHFRSYMLLIKDNIVAELTKTGIGFEMMYYYEKNKIILKHKGYVWKIFGCIIPLPLRFLFGTIYLEQKAISADTFHIKMQITNTFGKYTYSGILKILNSSAR